MEDEKFVWDDVKAASNFADHSVTFEAAREVFKDPCSSGLMTVSTMAKTGCHSGVVDSHMLYVAYTIQGEKIRIISTRGAEPHERRWYHEENR